MRNNVQHVHYFISKKQKKIFSKVFKKNVYYIFYKFEKKNNI